MDADIPLYRKLGPSFFKTEDIKGTVFMLDTLFCTRTFTTSMGCVMSDDVIDANELAKIKLVDFC